MVTDRWIEPSDITLLEISLAKDEHHKETTPDFFYAPGSVTKVYEDETGPVLFARGSKALRLDLQYVDNEDTKRNMRVMLDGFPALAKKAKESGFNELIFNTNSPLMRKFCIKRFGFVDSPGELRMFL